MIKKFTRLLWQAVMVMSALAADETERCSGWELSGDYLFLQPCLEDTYYVETSSALISNKPGNKRRNNPFDFQSGFRVGVDYRAPQSCRNFVLSYTFLNSCADEKEEDLIIRPSIGAPDFIRPFTNVPASFVNENLAKSHLDLQYQRGEFYLEQTLFCSCYLNTSFLLGLDLAHIELKENFEYTQSATQPSPFTIINNFGTIKQRSSTWGLGPQAGFKLDYHLNGCLCKLPGRLNLKMRGSGSLLAAWSKSKGANDFAGTRLSSSGLDVVVFNLDVKDDIACRLIPSFYAKTGIEYELCFARCQASLEIGYEGVQYLRPIARTRYVDREAPTLSYSLYDDLAFHGLYVSANLRF